MMIREQHRHLSLSLLIAFILSFLFVPARGELYAQTKDDTRGTLTMSLTPPLFQLTLAPGASWSSTLLLSNRNTYPLTLYTYVQNFTANSETGMITFATMEPSLNPNSHELASWMTLPEEPRRVEAGKTLSIPFTIRVPLDAEPGGHYAGVLVGTQPVSEVNKSGMEVGALLSSLFFVRTTGDVVESGYIRDFSTLHSVVSTQAATFALHFANTGNVHLSPAGAITIKNMFGRARGTIVLNEYNTFGHVLPNSSRQFIFAWKGEQNFFDIGRYTAVANISYGENLEKTAHDSTTFWVIPWKPLSIMFGALLFMFWFVRRVARRYVAHALVLERARRGGRRMEETDRGVSFSMLRAPLTAGTRDFFLINTKKKFGSASYPERITVQEFIKKYRIALLSLFIFLSFVLLMLLYFFQMFDNKRDYQMTVKRDGGTDVVVINDR